MTIGFGKTTTSKESVIASLSSSYLHHPDYLNFARHEWDTDYPARIHKPFTEEELFTPSPYSHHGPECFNRSMWNKDSKKFKSFEKTHVRELLQFGYWVLMVTQDDRGYKSKHFQEWDFSINVWCGNVFAFHPLEARNNILTYHSHVVYERWKETVLRDLSNFRELLSAYNPPVSMYSATCGKSSERVCRKAGLEVRDGFAYLIHGKGEECEHKTKRFVLCNQR
jgi:hypothetical protein